MDGYRSSVFFPLTLIVAGIAAFFLYLYVIGHDPDERPLTLFQWVIGGMLIGPGFGYLVKWRTLRDNRRTKVD